MNFRYLLVVLALLSTQLLAQISSGSKQMLARVERQQDAGESRCMLIYDDGSFHSEHLHSGRTDVVEGALDSGRFSQLNALIGSKEFESIHHEHLASAHYIDSPDLVSVDVRRDDGIQQIRLANRDDRKPFAAQMDPLLRWFDISMKINSPRVESAKANRCMPDKIETVHVVKGVAPAAALSNDVPYHLSNLLLLYIVEDYGKVHRRDLAGTKDCLLVHNDGAVYAYRIMVGRAGFKDEFLEMHSQLNAQQLGELNVEINDPALAASKEFNEGFKTLAREIDNSEVVIVRPTGVQHLRFMSATGITNYASTFRGDETQGGKGNDGSKETAPLQRWMKKNFDPHQLQKVEHLSGECP